MVAEILNQCEKDYQLTDDYAAPISSRIGETVQKYFIKGAEQSATRTKVFSKHKVPENISNMDTPKMNPGVMKLKSVSKITADNESKLYNIQNNVTRASMAVVKMLKDILEAENKSQLLSPKELVTTGLETLTLLGYASKELTVERKNNIKYSLDYQIRHLCDKDRPTTKYLLGDDLSKGARDAREVAKLAHKSPGSGNYNHTKKDWKGGDHRKQNGYSSHTTTKYGRQQQQSSKKPFLGKGRGANHKR